MSGFKAQYLYRQRRPLRNQLIQMLSVVCSICVEIEYAGLRIKICRAMKITTGINIQVRIDCHTIVPGLIIAFSHR